MRCEFGIFDHLDRGGRDLSDVYGERLSMLRAYDEAGFYAYHLAEHHGTTLGMAPSPGIFLAAAAQRTKRLRLGPMLYVLPLHDPVRLIEEICMLDQLSDGRLELGMGKGFSPFEAAFFGVSHLEAASIYDEARLLSSLGCSATSSATKATTTAIATFRWCSSHASARIHLCGKALRRQRAQQRQPKPARTSSPTARRAAFDH